MKPSPQKVAEFEAFMRGARMAYEDCAKFAMHIAISSGGFAEFATGQVDDATARLVAGSAKTICASLAESFVKKIEEMEGCLARAGASLQ